VSFPAFLRSDHYTFLKVVKELLQLGHTATNCTTLEFRHLKKPGIGLLKDAIEQLVDGSPSAIKRNGQTWHRLDQINGSQFGLLGMLE